MPLALTSQLTSSVRTLTALFCVLLSGIALAEDAGSITPRPIPLVDFSSPDAAKQITPTKGVPASIIKVDSTGISMGFPIQPAPHSGVYVTPATGKAWDLSACGHVEAKVTNLGVKALPFVMQVEDGSGRLDNCESVNVKPGETKVLKVVFGYQYGYESGAPIKPSNITQLYLFLWDTADPHSFRIEELKAGGSPGEKPEIDPNTLSYKPANGVILGKGVAFDPARQVETKGAQVSAVPDGALAVNFAGGAGGSLKIKPAVGMWDLTEGNQIRMRFKNTGQAAVTPSVVVGSTRASVKDPLAPGAETEIAVPFVPDFQSDKAKEITFTCDTAPEPRSLLLTSIVADTASDEAIPAWLGKRPPVDGDWTPTFAEEFDTPSLDYSKWNIYGSSRIAGNYGWNANHNQSRRTHFSKDSVILNDGQVLLRYQKKTGTLNDAPTGQQTDYASGYLSTFGKWTQRYGYFESRMKLPTAPGLWAACSLMPDRGKAAGDLAKRTSVTKLPVDAGVGGCEFDLVDLLSRWGGYRFNMALRSTLPHGEKAIAIKNAYVRPDKEGYITTGLLWTPGAAVFYHNGKEVFRSENARVSDVQSYIRYDMVVGGYNNNLVDDRQLPADFRIDYIRVWQRKDLATPEDGPKPTDGNPHENMNAAITPGQSR